jgi:putative salt-induced outer membrane protein YdiY
LRIGGPRFLLAAFLAVFCLNPSRLLAGQALPAPAWDMKLGFSYLATSGNAETSSTGFETAFNHAGPSWSVEGSAAGVSATKKSRRTAESYNAQARAKRRLRKRLQLTLGLRWERNRFAGLDERRAADVSLLWEVRETPAWKLRALSGLSFSQEDPRDPRDARNPRTMRPGVDSLGGLLQVSGDARVSPTASWDGQLTYFPNFNDSNDYRLQGHVGLQAALSRHLALRLGYDLKFDNEPVPGFGATDTSTTAALVLQLGGKALP